MSTTVTKKEITLQERLIAAEQELTKQRAMLRRAMVLLTVTNSDYRNFNSREEQLLFADDIQQYLHQTGG